MYIAPSSGHSLLTLILPTRVILRTFEGFFNVWSEKDELLKRFMKINSAILYYGFNRNLKQFVNYSLSILE